MMPLKILILCACALLALGCSYGSGAPPDAGEDATYDAGGDAPKDGTAEDADAGTAGDDGGTAGDDGGVAGDGDGDGYVNGDDAGPGGDDGQSGDQPTDCREEPCPQGFYCNLNTGECLPGCAVDSDCSAGEVCDTMTRECVGACADCLVINEIDYDQPSIDAAEFIELKNTGSLPISLGSYLIEMLNGNGNSVYRTVELPAVLLDPGDYYVICGDAANVPNCDLDVSPDTNLIQNDLDALAVILGGEFVDALGYEGDTGTPHTETSGSELEDLVIDPVSGADVYDMGLSRCPDGADTNNNNADFAFRGITPGAANNCP